MFGTNKKTNKEVVKKGVMPSSTGHSLNSLVEGTVVEGTVKSESDIRIDGVIKGSLDCKAKVIIGPSGLVEGDVVCENALIEGRFEGTMKVAGLLHIKETAKVDGDIQTGKLIVQSGAVFNVSCNMGSRSMNGVTKSQKQAKNIVETTSSQRIGQ